MKKRWLTIIAALLLLAMGATALAEFDNEEVTITFIDPNGVPLTGEDAVPDLDGDGYADVTPEPEPTPDPSAPVYETDGSILLTMSFTGDVTIGSDPRKSSSIFNKELKKQNGDIHFPFRNVKDIFAEDDLTMVNFEGTLTTAKPNPKKADYQFLFRADPSFAEILPAANIETVSYENNHADDMGDAGLAETKQSLMGVGVTYASEDEPCIMRVKGVTIGSLAYQGWRDRRDEVMAKLPTDIADLRAKGCDIVIVSFHWGNEKDYSPTETQIALGRGAVDAGADLVIGHHSHRINPIELYNGKYICYSLGNFSFAGNSKPDDMSTYIFQIRMRVMNGEVSNDAIKLIPCRISSRTDYNDFAPTPYDDQSKCETVINLLRQNGKKLDYALEDYPLKWPDEE